MTITIEFDPTAGTVKVTSPPSAEGDAVTQAATKPPVHGAALDAGAYAENALEEAPSAEGVVVTQTAARPPVQGAALDAGVYSGIALGEGPAAVPPPAINAGIATATGSPPTPHLDTFGLLTGISRSQEGLDAGSPKS